MDTKEKAIHLFKNGHNCAQAVVCACSEAYGVSPDIAYRISSGFGLGLSGTKTTCGAVSGMVMVASLHTCTGAQPPAPASKTTYPVVREMLEAFQKKNTFLDCGSLLEQKDNTLVDGKRTGCIQCVVDCCNIIEEYLVGKPR